MAVVRRGSFEIPNFTGQKSVSGLRFAPIISPPTPSQYLGIQSFALSAVIWPQFQCKGLNPKFNPPFGRVRVDLASKMVPIEISSPHSYSTSIHTIGLSCTVWPQYTTWQTTDRAIGKGRLCYSIGGPKRIRPIQIKKRLIRSVAYFSPYPAYPISSVQALFDLGMGE